MDRRSQLLTEEEVLKKLQRFAAKQGTWIFMDHPYQLQAEEAAVILKMLEKKSNDPETSSIP